MHAMAICQVPVGFSFVDVDPDKGIAENIVRLSCFCMIAITHHVPMSILVHEIEREREIERDRER